MANVVILQFSISVEQFHEFAWNEFESFNLLALCFIVIFESSSCQCSEFGNDCVQFKGKDWYAPLFICLHLYIIIVYKIGAHAIKLHWIRSSPGRMLNPFGIQFIVCYFHYLVIFIRLAPMTFYSPMMLIPKCTIQFHSIIPFLSKLQLSQSTPKTQIALSLELTKDL